MDKVRDCDKNLALKLFFDKCDDQCIECEQCTFVNKHNDKMLKCYDILRGSLKHKSDFLPTDSERAASRSGQSMQLDRDIWRGASPPPATFFSCYSLVSSIIIEDQEVPTTVAQSIIKFLNNKSIKSTKILIRLQAQFGNGTLARSV